jgi:dolichol-phosphate mannosyltransferase
MKNFDRAPRATVIIPTWNEAENVELLARRVHAALPDAEILFVDDASTDGTPDRVRAMAEDLPVRLIERRGERGLSTAVLRGIAEASADLCVVMDADFSHPPEALPVLVEAVERGADVAVGSRYVPGGSIDEWPWRRRMTSRAGTWLARPLTPVQDPLAGFFALRRRLLEGVDLRPRGFKILLEILARAPVRRAVEIPIRFQDREAGLSKFGRRERREFLKQVWTLYRERNAWPWKVLKFLLVGGLGVLVHLAVLLALVERGGMAPPAAAVPAFATAMSFNWALNRRWTFRARSRASSSYLAYAAGALGGLVVQVAVMRAMSPLPYLAAALAGIAAGTAVTYWTSQRWAFPRS